ncbi:sugar ABC transporter permease [Treponema sp. OttesenSCG-928-L16]|nr:sugar ABC transporter permease [Treponema sp. OttesenSCG-928-L16]
MKGIVSKKQIKFPPIILMFPCIILLLVVLVIPAIAALQISFTDKSIGTETNFIGITNYVKIFTDPQFLYIILNNLYFLAGSLLLEILIGMGGALLLNRRFKFQAFWICLILSPYAISSAVSVVAWKYLLDPDYGIINYLLFSLGFKPVKWFSSMLTSFIPIIITGVWKSFPFMVIILYAALSSIPVEIAEAAKIDGASRFTNFSKITLPLITPPLLTAVIFRMIFLIRAFEQIWIFTGGGPGRSTEILAISLYKEAFLFYDHGKASAIAWILLIITVIIAMPIIKNIINTNKR